MVTAASPSDWANVVSPPGQKQNEPVELPYLQQHFNRAYSWVAAGDAVPQAGKTSFVLDQYGEENFLAGTFESKYKYNLVLTAIPGSNRSVNFKGFQINASGFSAKPWFTAWCDNNNSIKYGLLDSAAEANFATLNNLSTTEALKANASCNCQGNVLSCTVWGDEGREFDSANWGSELTWKAYVRDQNSAAGDFQEYSSYGQYTWAGATALFATATTLYAASTMTF